MAYENLIPGCFGVGDLKFAVHPLDLKRAVMLLAECVQADASMQAVESAVRKFLEGKKANKDHIEREIASFRKLFAPWLE